MEPMHWQYLGALGGVIGIGWLVVVPMYRGWNQLNDRMTGRVARSIRMVAECERPDEESRFGDRTTQAGTMMVPSAKRTSAPSTETS